MKNGRKIQTSLVKENEIVDHLIFSHVHSHQSSGQNSKQDASPSHSNMQQVLHSSYPPIHPRPPPPPHLGVILHLLYFITKFKAQYSRPFTKSPSYADSLYTRYKSSRAIDPNAAMVMISMQPWEIAGV